jgi:hypothetical protein
LDKCLHAFTKQLGLLNSRLGQGHRLGKKVVIDGESSTHGVLFASKKTSLKLSYFLSSLVSQALTRLIAQAPGLIGLPLQTRANMGSAGLSAPSAQ